MTYGIVGLGLIGGSLAKAFKQAGMTVYGCELDASIQEFAKLCGAIDGVLDETTMPQCDCILIAISPRAACNWLESHAAQLPKSALVMDCCGTKKRICSLGFRLAEEYGFEFAGGHPMAGNHQWGFANSRADLFQGACFVAVPRVFDDIRLLQRIKNAIMPAGFGSVTVTTAQKHDAQIAFTSQLTHIVSNAFIQSPTALEQEGFSGGSYRDLTRVAWLNPTMWAELFMENKDDLLFELDIFLQCMQQYRDVIADGQEKALARLLDEGRQRKKEVDKL